MRDHIRESPERLVFALLIVLVMAYSLGELPAKGQGEPATASSTWLVQDNLTWADDLAVAIDSRGSTHKVASVLRGSTTVVVQLDPTQTGSARALLGLHLTTTAGKLSPPLATSELPRSSPEGRASLTGGIEIWPTAVRKGASFVVLSGRIHRGGSFLLAFKVDKNKATKTVEAWCPSPRTSWSLTGLEIRAVNPGGPVEGLGVRKGTITLK